MINIVVAKASNNVIGAKNDLIWHLPNDLKHFKSITSGHPIIMGRKTFESLGRPLPNRTNIVVTGDQNWNAESIEIASSLPKAIEAAKVPVVEKIKELDQQLKAKTDETADYLKTYKQVTAKIVNTYPMAEPEPVENKRIPNAKPVSTRQSSDFPSARKIH